MIKIKLYCLYSIISINIAASQPKIILNLSIPKDVKNIILSYLTWQRFSERSYVKDFINKDIANALIEEYECDEKLKDRFKIPDFMRNNPRSLFYDPYPISEPAYDRSALKIISESAKYQATSEGGCCAIQFVKVRNLATDYINDFLIREEGNCVITDLIFSANNRYLTIKFIGLIVNKRLLYNDFRFHAKELLLVNQAEEVENYVTIG